VNDADWDLEGPKEGVLSLGLAAFFRISPRLGVFGKIRALISPSKNVRSRRSTSINFLDWGEVTSGSSTYWTALLLKEMLLVSKSNWKTYCMN
jgi:hypothetical protein